MALRIADKISSFKSLDFKNRLAIITVASLFLPYFFCVPFILFTVSYALVTKQIRRELFNVSGARFLLVLPAISLLSSLYAKNFLGVIGAFAIFCMFACGVYFRMVMTKQLFEKIIKTVCLLSIVSCLVGIYQMLLIRTGHGELYKSLYFLFDNNYFTGLINAYNSYRSVSTFYNANYFAAIASFIALICVFKLLSAKQNRLFYISVFAVNIVNMFLAGSRTAFIALGVGILLLMLTLKKYKGLIIFIVFLTAIVLLFIFFPSYMPRLDSLFSTVVKRVGIWEGAFELIKNNIFNLFLGQGMWTYMFNALRDQSFVYAVHAHNMYLEFLLCFGLIGVFLIISYITKSVLAVRYNKTHKYKYNALMIATGGLVAVSGFTDVIITGIESGLFILILFSAVGIYEKRKVSESV